MSLLTLQRLMKDQQTDPILQQIIVESLQQWVNEIPVQGSHPVASGQAVIRIECLIDRWLSCSWQHHQDQVWKQYKSRRSSLRWTAALIQKLWDVAWDMWEHQNEALHSSQLAQQQILHSIVDAQIRILYGRGPQQLPLDALHFITQPLELILSYSLRSKQQ